MTATRKGIENKAGTGEIKNLTDVCYKHIRTCKSQV